MCTAHYIGILTEKNLPSVSKRQIAQPTSTYSADVVCSLLDNSLTDSLVSSEDGDLELSSSEYDLIDPEAGLTIREAEMTVYSPRSLSNAGSSHKCKSQEQDRVDLEVSLVRNESSALIDCNGYSHIQGNGLGADHDRPTDSFDSSSMGLGSSSGELDGTISGIGSRYQITVGREGSVRGQGRSTRGHIRCQLTEERGMTIGREGSVRGRGRSTRGHGRSARGHERLTEGSGRLTKNRGRSARG